MRLNLANLAAVRGAYQEIIDEVKANRPDAKIHGVAIEPMIQKPNGRELMVGVISDQIFGPAILLRRRRHRRRCPAARPRGGAAAAQQFPGGRHACIDCARAPTLGKFRNMPPVNMAALEAVLLRVSEMVCELPWMREMDINPLIVDENGAIAVDARIVIEPAAAHGRPLRPHGDPSLSVATS